jgi:hypothetical protein
VIIKLYFQNIQILHLPRLRSRGLPTTTQRLGAAAAFSHYLSNPHVPPPLRQTASCAFGIFLELMLRVE